ncbi:hypothetical protein Misp01_31160 [Microtetraspora sp. NBRC 13810]|nr:hypothetical protein Misp01_31160 [Microtetraspora sp. NBRC 13810]
MVNYMGVTTRCCGPNLEARNHERKSNLRWPQKSLLSPALTPSPGVSRPPQVSAPSQGLGAALSRNTGDPAT